MKDVSQYIGCIKTGKEDVKRLWKIKNEQPYLFIFLQNIQFMGGRFRSIFRGNLFKEAQVVELNRKAKNFYHFIKELKSMNFSDIVERLDIDKKLKKKGKRRK